MTLAYGFKGDRPYISTVRGGRFYIDDPVFDIQEIAHALSMLCRFGGHCKRFYSVAEHSILVAELCNRFQLAEPFEGLMHDAHEAYLVDMPKPWKSAISGYESIETWLERAMRVQYRMPAGITPGCKLADQIALAIEARALLPGKGEDFAWPAGVLEKAEESRLSISCRSPELAREAFWRTYSRLSAERIA